MNEQEYEQLSNDLIELSRKIPLHWGAVQNNVFDNKLNFFEIKSYLQLENSIAKYEKIIQNYYRRRWFLWQCSICDEYLFLKNSNVRKNPIQYDKSYDIEFNGDSSYRFDIKGTVIPRNFRLNVSAILQNPQPIIDFYYKHQSQGIRYGIQNRLFIVHHSFVLPMREMYLRCAWHTKEAIYSEYCQKVGTKHFFYYLGHKSDVIFVLEREPDKFEHILF